MGFLPDRPNAVKFAAAEQVRKRYPNHPDRFIEMVARRNLGIAK